MKDLQSLKIEHATAHRGYWYGIDTHRFKKDSPTAKTIWSRVEELEKLIAEAEAATE